MAGKTFLIQLYFIEKAVYRYITKNRVKIEQNATAQQLECILAVLTAIETCLPLIVPAPPAE